ncbi:MAG: hypothetical protein WAV16_03415 [Candidatus Moraniibacteriota bacterium]
MTKNINSFLAVGIIFVLSLAVFYLLWLSLATQLETPTQTKNINNFEKKEISSDYNYALGGEGCTIESCLLSQKQYDSEAIISPVGVARIEGYYNKVMKSSRPYGCVEGDNSEFCEEYTVECEEFIITRGGENIFPKKLGFNNVEKSIIINSNNSDYKFLTKDDGFNLSEVEKGLLVGSSIKNPVKLTILKYKAGFATEVGICFSDNAIIRVN